MAQFRRASNLVRESPTEGETNPSSIVPKREAINYDGPSIRKTRTRNDGNAARYISPRTRKKQTNKKSTQHTIQAPRKKPGHRLAFLRHLTKPAEDLTCLKSKRSLILSCRTPHLTTYKKKKKRTPKSQTY